MRNWQEAQVHTIIRTLTGIAATAALGAVLVVGTPAPARAQTQGAQPAAQPAQPAKPARNCKDTTECDLINAIIKDLQGQDQQKTLTDLNNWSQKYPESDWKDDRPAWYQQAYTQNPPQPDKVVEYGGQLMNKDLDVLYKENKLLALQVLLRTTVAVTQIKNPSAEQLATGEKAAKQLLAFLSSPANRPAGMTEEAWNGARAQTEPIAKATLAYIAAYPGDQLVAKAQADPKDSDQQKADYAAAEQAYRTAYQANPDMGILAYKLGSAIVSQKKPETYPQGLYFIARAAALDPSKGGIADPATRSQIDAYLAKAYTGFHGSDEGLAELKQQAAASPMPPPDFKIKSSTEISLEKQKEFEQNNPELARWMGIKAALAAPDGEQFFATNMKDAQVPPLKGQVMEGKPECNPKELLVAVPLPDQKGTVVPEITLKLETALKGKPVAGQEISFTGVPTAFSKEPFMLTMDVDKEHTPELKLDPCTPARATPKGPAKGGTKKSTGTPATKKK
jgi:hypothetical protein